VHIVRHAPLNARSLPPHESAALVEVPESPGAERHAASRRPRQVATGKTYFFMVALGKVDAGAP
jgi:hypothetical protein